MIRILVVDEDTEVLTIAEHFLQKQGDLDVETSTSAQAALERLRENGYDAVVSDYQMPGMDGITFLREVRSRFGDLPFLILTGKSREDVAIEALNSGATGYIRKEDAGPEALFASVAAQVRQAVFRTRAERDLRESEARYADLVENASDMIQSVRPDGSFLFVNRAWKETLGYSDEDLLTLTLFDILAPECIETCMDHFSCVLSGECLLRFDVVFIAKDGRRIEAEGNASCRFEDGHPIATRGIFRDLTDLREGERELKIKEAAIESSINGIILADGDGRITYANPAFCEMWAFSSLEEAQSVRVVDLFQNRRRAEDIYAVTIHEGRWIGEISGEKRDGRIFPVQVSGSSVGTKRDSSVSVMFSLVDLTEIAAMRETQQTILSNLLEGVMILDFEGTILHANQRMADMFGISLEEGLGQNLYSLISDDDMKERAREDQMRVREGKGGFLSTYRISLLSGREVWFEGLGTKINFHGKKANIVFIRDITARKEAEKELRIKEAAIESSINAIVMVGPDLRIFYSNPSFAGMFGYESPADVMGYDLLSFSEKGRDTPGLSEVMEEIGEKGGWVGSIAARRRDGTFFPAQLSATVVRDAEGHLICTLGSVVDMTELKEAHNDMIAYITEAALRLKNPVDLVRANLEELIEGMEEDLDDERLREMLQIQAKNASQIVKNLSDLQKAIVEGKKEIPNAYREFLNS